DTSAVTLGRRSIELAPPSAVEHFSPREWGDRLALGLCKVLRFLADALFRSRYLHRAVVLETVAAVPGMVGATLQHLRSLRVMRGRADMVKALMDEAENERMHLMAFVKICQPTFTERMLILLAQGTFFNFFFFLYLISPHIAHRMVGYFEEEAVISYTRFLDAIDRGHIANLDIPDFARDYWSLGAHARLRELVVAVRADEAGHRDVNHHLAFIEGSR
ncbi:MAG: alternative oxidase, partial [Burkholderiaceae bacterium]